MNLGIPIFSIIDVLGLFIIYQCITFIIGMLLTIEKDSTFKYTLAFLLLLIALNFSNMILISQQLIDSTLNFGIVFGFLYGPLFYVYTSQITSKNDPEGFSVSFWHFTLAIISFILLIVGFGYPIVEQLLEMVTVFIVFYNIVYLAYAIILINRFRRNLQVNFSAIEDKNLSWLRSILIFFILLIFLVLVEAFLPQQFRNYSSGYLLMSIHVFTLIVINLIYYRGLRYPEIYMDYVIKDSSSKYEGSKLTEPDLNVLEARLDELLRTEEVFKDFDLTIKSLASQLNENPRAVSQAINKRLNMNFYEFINQHRLKHAKKLLTTHSNDDMRIKEVMYASGFSSKSSFNSFFKKKTGMTPKSFRSSHQK